MWRRASTGSSPARSRSTSNPPTQPRNEVGEVGRWRRFELEAPLVVGVIEGQAPGVERVARKLNPPQLARAERVPLLADQSMAAEPRLDPDLIPPAGVQAHFEQRGTPQRFNHPVM